MSSVILSIRECNEISMALVRSPEFPLWKRKFAEPGPFASSTISYLNKGNNGFQQQSGWPVLSLFPVLVGERGVRRQWLLFPFYESAADIYTTFSRGDPGHYSLKFKISA